MDNEVKAKIIELEKEIEHILLGQYDQQKQIDFLKQKINTRKISELPRFATDKETGFLDTKDMENYTMLKNKETGFLDTELAPNENQSIRNLIVESHQKMDELRFEFTKSEDRITQRLVVQTNKLNNLRKFPNGN